MSAYEVRRDHMEPLWDRVDRNRWQLAVVVALFSLCATTLLTLVTFMFSLVAVMVVVGALPTHTFAELWPALKQLPGWAALASASGVGVYVVRSLTRSERWFAERLGATLTATGEFLPTKLALKDMAIAAGIDVAPALYLIETPNVNAFVYGRPGRRPILGVTRGLIERLGVEEQRAVFANLMARLRSGDTISASALTALMAPFWRVRTAQMKAPDDELMGIGRQPADPWTNTTQASFARAVLDVSVTGLFGFWLTAALVVASELLAFGHMRTHNRAAEAADAEGMLLLKDPRSMLSTLEKAVRFNNYVPFVGTGMMQLFYTWCSDFSTDDEGDPSNQRIARLREVLGVAGMPVQPLANEATFELVPPAPRLGDAALLPATRDPIAVSDPGWWFGFVAALLGSMSAIGRYNGQVGSLARGVLAGSAGWEPYSAAVANLEVQLLWTLVAFVFLGALLTGRSWAGVLSALLAFTWLAAAVLVRAGDPGLEPGRYLGWALVALLAAGVGGGLLGGLVGRRLARSRR